MQSRQHQIFDSICWIKSRFPSPQIASVTDCHGGRCSLSSDSWTLQGEVSLFDIGVQRCVHCMSPITPISFMKSTPHPFDRPFKIGRGVTSNPALGLPPSAHRMPDVCQIRSLGHMLHLGGSTARFMNLVDSVFDSPQVPSDPKYLSLSSVCQRRTKWFFLLERPFSDENNSL